MRRGQALALAVAIRELVVTTDPLVVNSLLRDGGDSSLLCLWCVVKRDCDWGVAGTVLLVGSLCFVCGESTTLYWLKGVVGVFNYRERSEYV